jgi:hypothetical protein
VRHLTSRTAALAAATALLVGCTDDGAADGIALDDAGGSSPEAIEDDVADDGDTADAGASDADSAGANGGEPDARADETDAGTGTEVVDGTEAVPGTWQVGEAGTVTFDVVDGALVLEDVSEADGWTVTDIEEEPDEIGVDLRRGDVEGDEIEIELRNGAMRWDADVELNGSIEVELDYEVSGQL